MCQELREELFMTTVAEVFDTIQSRFKPAAAAGVKKTLQWNISGAEAGQWTIRIANQTCEVSQGPAEKPDLTLTLADQDWIAIAEGRLNPMSAFMSGKIKAAGDLMLATKLQNLFDLSPR
jgi:putative sterol carrier protein